MKAAARSSSRTSGTSPMIQPQAATAGDEEDEECSRNGTRSGAGGIWCRFSCRLPNGSRASPPGANVNETTATTNTPRGYPELVSLRRQRRQRRRRQALLCLLAVPLLIGLHVQLVGCRSIEVADPLSAPSGNSLLNSNSTQINSLLKTTTTQKPQPHEIVGTTEETPEEDKGDEEEDPCKQEDGSSSGCDDGAAASGASLSADPSAETKNLTDNERLVNLQSWFQQKVRRQLMSTTRSGMEMFEQLSLSGGCSASLMTLMNSLGQLKSFAFKFLDASAKVPSGMMNGLLSDYGDFDQCMSIRSNRDVPLEEEADEPGAISGKYCLMSLKVSYHVKLAPNETVPEGIIEDGIFWDEIVRHYWTSKISKGFQIGMCFPSRCTEDDLKQLYQHVSSKFNLMGEIISCQDALDLKRQYQPDLLQSAILYIFYGLLGLTLIGSLVDRCCCCCTTSDSEILLALANVLVCFSLSNSWTKFMHGFSKPKISKFRVAREEQSASSPPRRSPIEQQTSLTNRVSATTSTSDDVDFIDSDPDTSSANTTDASLNNKLSQPLTVQTTDHNTCAARLMSLSSKQLSSSSCNSTSRDDPLAHLSGLKLLIIVWITLGYSFLYPSANNYQYYRSIIKMNFTRDSVWFATTNFTLGIDMLLYITGLLFVCKLLGGRSVAPDKRGSGIEEDRDEGVLSLISRRAIRFWPTYLTVIGFAIAVPLISDGPMWPEMVSKRLGQSCRQNWWANLLFINNYLGQSDICLPSSWFISILMQLFFVGSIIVVLVRKISLFAGLAILSTLLMSSMGFSFCFAYFLKLRAPVIKMDESFVMDPDENIFRLYTNIFNNLGPFLVGMAGGLLLIHCRKPAPNHSPAVAASKQSPQTSKRSSCLSLVGEMAAALAVAVIAVLVLSSVFHEQYTQLASSIYWSLHRIGWAVVTGYVIHQCATGKWKLLNDLLSLSAFAPLSRLIFIAYLVYPIFIHIHTGLVRDGLHVSIYNMLNIYITRLVMTFITALVIHLLVELPFSALDEMYLREWTRCGRASSDNIIGEGISKSDRMHPLLALAPPAPECHKDATIDVPKSTDRQMQPNNSPDKLIHSSRQMSVATP